MRQIKSDVWSEVCNGAGTLGIPGTQEGGPHPFSPKPAAPLHLRRWFQMGPVEFPPVRKRARPASADAHQRMACVLAGEGRGLRGAAIQFDRDVREQIMGGLRTGELHALGERRLEQAQLERRYEGPAAECSENT